jgi:hypothetical protein
LENETKSLIRVRRVGLHIYEQGEPWPARENLSAILFHKLGQRIEVERLQRPLGPDVLSIMRDEELSIHQPDVRLDAAKPLFQRVEQRAWVKIVIVRVRLAKWFCFLRSCAGRHRRERANESQGERVKPERGVGSSFHGL